ncbi:MAG: response regulator FixJ [Hyphomonadaceae bacterium]
MNDVVHIVDDDKAVRDSIAFLLQVEGLAPRVYESAEALLAEAGALQPGCIITDVRMPGLNGLELVEQLNSMGARLPIIMLTGHADVALAVAAMKLGVVDFLEKPFDDAALLAAVRAALARRDAAHGQDAERAEIEARLNTLTGRERDVFEAVVAGDSNKAAAAKLGISPRTVEIYRANVMTKMKAQTLSDLVRMALKAGLG